ncbi:hypothetical protein LIER_09540 [Lithospermum erythrorhizon]|uniref:FAR1 domain-containing protein n=1 Tax=Lithospermum erythrorhizon TaxID=34254 RepID=A0AAV3PKC2_LITER
MYHPDDVEGWKNLVFTDENEAYEFYVRYGRSRGFAIRFAGCVKKTKKEEGVVYVHYVYLECHRQGVKNENKNDIVVSHKRTYVRTECQANMRLKINWNVNGYVIYEWTDVHNHDLINANKVHLLPMFRKIMPLQKTMIDMHISCGISERATYVTLLRTYGGHSNIG